jgi:hypothetical protein
LLVLALLALLQQTGFKVMGKRRSSLKSKLSLGESAKQYTKSALNKTLENEKSQSKLKQQFNPNSSQD